GLTVNRLANSGLVAQRRKSVRFSLFEKGYYTHSPIDYDHTFILAELAQQKK
ncbi:4904_t:CDS:1, partial [Racocetra persica]